MASRHRVPVWIMGLTNLPFGVYGGVVAFGVPQLLAQRNVPEGAIAGLSAVAFSPGFWAFLVSPILDVRFSRRQYAFGLSFAAALLMFVAFLNLDDIVLLEIVLTAGMFAVTLYQSAVGGWLSSITSGEEENTVSVWMTIGNLGSVGMMAVCCNQLVRHLSPPAVALTIGAVILLPTLLFPFMQAPGPDRRLASESFPQFFGDLISLVKRREVLVAILLFIAPAGTFSLTNFFGSRGGDFHASPAFVGLVGGMGVLVGSVFGCLIFPALGKLMPLRPFYLSVGAVGALCTLAMALLPRVPASYAVILIAENIFQSLAITTSMAVTLETIGRDNPLASTTFCFVISAYCVPISYMLYVDAFGFARAGITGALAFDALTGIIACALLATMLLWLARRPETVTAQ